MPRESEADGTVRRNSFVHDACASDDVRECTHNHKVHLNPDVPLPRRHSISEWDGGTVSMTFAAMRPELSTVPLATAREHATVRATSDVDTGRRHMYSETHNDFFDEQHHMLWGGGRQMLAPPPPLLHEAARREVSCGADSCTTNRNGLIRTILEQRGGFELITLRERAGLHAERLECDAAHSESDGLRRLRPPLR